MEKESLEKSTEGKKGKGEKKLKWKKGFNIHSYFFILTRSLNTRITNTWSHLSQQDEMESHFLVFISHCDLWIIAP